MKDYILKRIFTVAGVFGLLAGGAVAAPQAATNNGKAVAPTNAAVAPLAASPAPQPYAPIGGAFTPALMGRTSWPGYFSRTNPAALGGVFGSGPVGGTLVFGSPLGGVLNAQNPPGGRLTNILVGGPTSSRFPSFGALNGQPLGGQFGTNVLGGIRSPVNSYTAGPRGVIIGGAQPAGASPGGVIVSGAPPGGVMTNGTSPGGVIVSGAPPITNAPGGHLH